jgi:hypothetical protein
MLHLVYETRLLDESYLWRKKKVTNYLMLMDGLNKTSVVSLREIGELQ